MALEIERKFLVVNAAWRADADAGVVMRQGYLATSAGSSVRVRVSGQQADLNIKESRPGLVRQEFEYPIPLADAEAMLAGLCESSPIDKVRHRVRRGEVVWEIDVYAGANAGLVIAEIELEHPDQAFDRPEWLGEEVSHDLRYYNVCLARHPFRDWG
jgi:adenylate cyclase